MRVRYVFPINPPLLVDDHWRVPLLGGHCRLVEENGLVTAIEFTKAGLSTDLAFEIKDTPTDPVSKGTITGRDDVLLVVRDHIRRAFSFIQCFFNTEVSIDEVEIHHEAETPEEAAKIAIPKFQMGKAERRPLPLTYDFFTRPLMASVDHEGPEFVATLAHMAREAFISRRYIDSFRFSFLLIESQFGGGKFKSKQLADEFLASPQLVDAIQHVIDDWKNQPPLKPSQTHDLMEGGPSVSHIVDHLISKRGHYFHGNIAKGDAWHPAKQEEAEALAALAVGIVLVIGTDAAGAIFDEAYNQRHFTEAEMEGAIVVMDVKFHFRMPPEDFIRNRIVRVRMPGTRPTTRMAMEVAHKTLKGFVEDLPDCRLHSVSALNAADGKEVFSMRFLTEPDGKFVD